MRQKSLPWQELPHRQSRDSRGRRGGGWAGPGRRRRRSNATDPSSTHTRRSEGRWRTESSGVELHRWLRSRRSTDQTMAQDASEGACFVSLSAITPSGKALKPVRAIIKTRDRLHEARKMTRRLLTTLDPCWLNLEEWCGVSARWPLPRKQCERGRGLQTEIGGGCRRRK